MLRRQSRSSAPSLISSLHWMSVKSLLPVTVIALSAIIPITSVGSAPVLTSSTNRPLHTSVTAAARGTSLASSHSSTSPVATSIQPSTITMSLSRFRLPGLTLAPSVTAVGSTPTPSVGPGPGQPSVSTSQAWQSALTYYRIASNPPPPPTPMVASRTTVSATPVPPVPPPATTPAITSSGFTVSADEIAAVAKIAFCEEGGGWFYSGAAYPDSVGITATNWFDNGGGSCITDVCQTQVELVFAARYLGGRLPDQNGCGGGY